MSLKMLFDGNNFGNVDCSHYYQKPETIHSHMVCQCKVFNNDDILYIVDKFLKSGIQW